MAERTTVGRHRWPNCHLMTVTARVRLAFAPGTPPRHHANRTSVPYETMCTTRGQPAPSRCTTDPRTVDDPARSVETRLARSQPRTTICCDASPTRTTTSCVFGLDCPSSPAYRSPGRLHKPSRPRTPTGTFFAGPEWPPGRSARTTVLGNAAATRAAVSVGRGESRWREGMAARSWSRISRRRP